MKDPLSTYLHDHRAGAEFALELLGSMQEQHQPRSVGKLIPELLREIEVDLSTLEQIARRIDGGKSVGKTAVSWLAEKASRLKLRHHSDDEFGTFESLEALALGILGKEALWKALSAIQSEEPRLRGFDYSTLAARARDQFNRVETERLNLAAQVFSLPANYAR